MLNHSAGPWLVKYLTVSSFAEQERVMKCINLTIKKIASTRFSLTPDALNQAQEVIRMIYQVFVPYALQTFSKGDSCREVAELAANLCLHSDMCHDTTINGALIFKQFTDIKGVNLQ